jgi:WD40 repeat protein
MGAYYSQHIRASFNTHSTLFHNTSSTVCMQSAQTLTCLAASEDVTLLAAGHSHSAVRLHNLTEATRAPAPAVNGSTASPLTVAQGDACKDLWGHAGPVYGVSFSPDGRLLYSSGCDGTVRVWATEMGANLVVWRCLHPVWAVKASPIGHWVASGGADWTCKLWCDPMQTSQLHGAKARMHESGSAAGHSVSLPALHSV